MRKRSLIGLLVTGLLLQSVYLPVQAASVDPLGGGRPAAVTLSIEEAAQTDGDSEGRTGEKLEQTPSETKENAEGGSDEQPGTEESGEDREGDAPDTEEGGEDRESDMPGTEEGGEDREGDAPGTEESGEDRGSDMSGTEENEEAQDNEGDEGASDEDGEASVSENAAEDVLTDDGKEPEAVLLSLEELEMITAEASDGIFQEGSFSVLGERTGATAQNWDNAVAYCYEQMLQKAAEINLTEYGILKDDCSKFFSAVINSHPDLYFVDGSFSYSNSDGVINTLKPTYRDGYDDAAFQAAVSEAMGYVQPGMTELEKAIVFHEYLTGNCECDDRADTIPRDSYSAYGALVNGAAVCQGYALAYLLLLNQAGIDCYMVTSASGNNVWNLISLNGQYYQVDVAQDDPAWDRLGQSFHKNMFLSDAALQKTGHRNWKVTFGSSIVEYTAADTRYDDAFWSQCRSPIVIKDNYCYYISFDGDSVSGVIKKGTLSDPSSDSGKMIKNIGQWKFWGSSSGCYGRAYSGLFLFNDRLYYNTSTAICSIDFDGTGGRKDYTPDTSTGYIFGSALRRGKVVYTLHQDIDAEAGEKETVLIADNTGELPEPEPDIPTVDIVPSEGNAVMGFSGTYYTETAEKMLKRLNEIRLEACKEGVPNPNSKEPLTMDDYVPLRWSADMEAIARQRAAEAAFCHSHTRPNGQGYSTVMTENGVSSRVEDLAWNYSGVMEGIEQWYSEKDNWVKQVPGAVTGHYTSIINPRFRGVGLSAFRLSSGGWYVAAQELQYDADSFNEYKNPGHGACVQPAEVSADHIQKIAFEEKGQIYLGAGQSRKLSPQITVMYPNFLGENTNYKGLCMAGGTWTSDKPEIADVNDQGVVTAKPGVSGTVNISVRFADKTAAIAVIVGGEADLFVQPPAKTTYRVGERINVAGGKVTYVASGKTNTKTMTASMIQGFDSSRPGVCSVTVSCAGRVASFDTLIVGEPEVRAEYGKKLKDVILPENENGAYEWTSDPETVIDRIGVSTYQAKFTPKDLEKYQILMDLNIDVAAYVTITDGDVTLQSASWEYTSGQQKPKPVVSIDGNRLTEGQDYELTYRNNINAGVADVTVRGIRYCQGSVTKTFTITPAPLTIRAKDKNILIGEQIPKADSEEYKSFFDYAVIGLCGSDRLKTPPVMTLSKDGVPVSNPVITSAVRYDIVPDGADAGENYEISYEKGRLTAAEERASCTVVFDVQGHGTAPEDMIGVKVGSTIGRPAEPAAEGYRFDGWYKDAACTKAWDFDTEIVQADTVLYAKWIESGAAGILSLQVIPDGFYTGSAYKPAVSVYDGDMLLKSGRDYTVKYANNINAAAVDETGRPKTAGGTAIVTDPGKKTEKIQNIKGSFTKDMPYLIITGKGNYAQTIYQNYVILPASIGTGETADGFSLKYSDQLTLNTKKAQNPFSSLKYKKAMKLGTDYLITLEAGADVVCEQGIQPDAGTEPSKWKKDTAEDLSNPKKPKYTAPTIPKGYSGTFTMTVTGTGNYTGSFRKTVSVTDKNHLMKNASVTLGKNQKNITPDPGSAAVTLTPSTMASADTFVVKFGKTVLEPGADYTVSYRNNDRVGKAELIITGRNDYAGSKTVTFNIKGTPFNAKTVEVKTPDAAAGGGADAEDAFRSSMTYTGSALTQNKVKLTARAAQAGQTAKELVYGSDYTVSYKNNIKKGTATVTFTAKPESGYTGSIKKTFKITAADLGRGGVQAEAVKAAGNETDELTVSSGSDGSISGCVLKGTVFYSKAGAKPSGRIRLTDRSGNVLKEGTDYTVTYKNNKAVTTAQTAESSKPCMTVKGKGNYTGSFPVFFEISPAPLAENADIAAAASAMAYDAKKADDYLYQPKVKVTDGRSALRAGKDYEIEYWNNSQSQVDAYLQKYGGKGEKESDTPQIIVTACEGGCYTGQLSIPLPVYRNKLTASNLQVTVRQDSDKGIVYTGSRVTPEVEVRYMDGTTSRLLEEGADYSLSYGANVQSGRNKGSVTVTGLAPQYGGSVTVKFTIVQKAIAY